MRQLKLYVCIAFIITSVGFALYRSAAVAGQAAPASLGSPTGFTASDNSYNNKVGLYWEPISGATNYRIFRSATNNSAAASDVGITAANTIFDLSAPANQTFFYWVRAENSSTVSSLSSSDQGSRTNTVQQGPVPPLEPPPAPPGNPVTAAKAYLGKALFWDEQMSSSRTVSCGSCHHAGAGGTDPRSVPSGPESLNPGLDGFFNTPDDVRGSLGTPANNTDGTYLFTSAYGFDDQVTGRKTVSYVDAAYAPTLFWDGRATGQFRDPLTNSIVLNNGAALESQILGPPVSSAEMAHVGRTWTDVASRISVSKPLALSPTVPQALSTWIGGRTYPELFLEAFGSPDVTPTKIALAIATYERTLYSDQTPLDLVNGGIGTLTPAENRGRGIFAGPAGCAVCHGGPNSTDNAFHFDGVRPQNEDTGRFQVTGNQQNLGEFRTPSLRNVELRGSYFHNGQFTTLEQVVAFYNRGGDFNGPNKPINLIRPLGLNAQQQADLVAFLKRPFTDPRVAAETAQFDHPTLYMESSRVPQLTGTSRSGSGAFAPQIKAISPPIVGNPNFTVSVSAALGNSSAVLVIDTVDPGLGESIPTVGSLARITAFTQNSGAGNGTASVSIPIPDSVAVSDQTYYARWYVQDPGAVSGFSVTQAAKFTVFGQATASSTFLVSGRVMTPDGRGLRNASVILLDAAGNSRRVTTNTFGIYTFDSVMSGTNYTITATSKLYRFASQNIFVSGDLANVDLVGIE